MVKDKSLKTALKAAGLDPKDYGSDDEARTILATMPQGQVSESHTDGHQTATHDTGDDNLEGGNESEQSNSGQDPLEEARQAGAEAAQEKVDELKQELQDRSKAIDKKMVDSILKSYQEPVSAMISKEVTKQTADAFDQSDLPTTKEELQALVEQKAEQAIEARKQEIQPPRQVEFNFNDSSTQTQEGEIYHDFAPLATLLAQIEPVLLVGGSQSGKSHFTLEQLPTLLDSQLFYQAGYADADATNIFGTYFHETYLATSYSKFATYQGNALYVADEIDRMHPDTGVAYHGGMANNMLQHQFMIDGNEYPTHIVGADTKYWVGTANTYLMGGSDEYIAAQEHDAAFRARWCQLPFPYLKEFLSRTMGLDRDLPKYVNPYDTFHAALAEARPTGAAMEDAHYNYRDFMFAVFDFMESNHSDRSSYLQYTITPTHLRRGIRMMQLGLPMRVIEDATWAVGMSEDVKNDFFNSIINSSGIGLEQVGNYTDTMASMWEDCEYYKWYQK